MSAESSIDEPRKSKLQFVMERVDGFIGTYVKEPMLWPVFLALLGHFVVVLAPLMLYVVRDASIRGATGLIVAAGVCGLPFIRGGWRRYRALRWSVLGTWLASIAAAWLANVYEVI